MLTLPSDPRAAVGLLAVQQDRIRQIAHKMNQTCKVRFDEEASNVKFVIYSSSDILLVKHSEERTPDWWAALSEGEVQDRLSRLSNGML
jgi:hypothetical protein